LLEKLQVKTELTILFIYLHCLFYALFNSGKLCLFQTGKENIWKPQ